MSAAVKITELPFSDRRDEDPALITLRHARIPLRAHDRLLLLQGHPLLFRLGLYAVTERALAGEPVVYLDGASTFDPFWVGRMARAHHQQPRKVLAMIHVARAYTCQQMERLLSDCLSAALDRYQARIAVLSGLLDTFYDRAVPDDEAWRLFGRMMEAIRRLTQQGFILLCLCPPAPILTSASRRSLDHLRSQADRIICVHEAGQGIVLLEEERGGSAQSWRVARSLLEPVDHAKAR